MAKDIQFPQSVNMAGLKSKGPGEYDLMRPGNGTPWEDRGTVGAVVAYFKTAFKGIISPGLLLDHIRRPETTADASIFAIVSGAMWVLGLIVLRVWQYHTLSQPNSGFDLVGSHYAISVAAQCALVGTGVWMFLNVGTRLYLKLSAAELRNATPALIHNLFCYCLGPSLLALAPIYGQGLALLLIFINLVVAGKKRLFLKGSSAVVNVFILYFCALSIAVVVYYVGHLLWSGYFDMSGVTPVAAPKASQGMMP